MNRMSGTFRRRGQVVAERADVWVAVAGSGQVALWYGSFRLPPHAVLEEAGEYELELEDGRHGTVTVSSPYLQRGYRVGGFTGRGPLLGSST